MKTTRLHGGGRSLYHAMSCVVDRRRVFRANDNEVFRKTLRIQETFSGVQVVTY